MPMERGKVTWDGNTPSRPLLPPHPRHFIKNVKLGMPKSGRNTVIEPWVDMTRDLRGIAAGRGKRVGNEVTINDRTYGWHPETSVAYPIRGRGFHELDRPTYDALAGYNSLDGTALKRYWNGTKTTQAMRDRVRALSGLRGKRGERHGMGRHLH